MFEFEVDEFFSCTRGYPLTGGHSAPVSYLDSTSTLLPSLQLAEIIHILWLKDKDYTELANILPLDVGGKSQHLSCHTGTMFV